MNKELLPISEPLTVNSLPMREQDHIECQRALFGKRAAFFYAVIAVCCAATIAVCMIAKWMGINGLPMWTETIPFICFLLASSFYYAFPKYVGKLRYRQCKNANEKPRAVAFYTDHFETLIGDIKAGSYSYETVQRIIKTENFWIIMLPDRVYLPVRLAGIPDEYREVIEQDIAAMVNGCRKADWKK